MPLRVWCFIACFICPAGLFAEGTPDACEAAVPPALSKQLRVAYPQHRPPRENDNRADDIAYAAQKGGSRCLGVDSADFDGDGTRDFAVLLTPKTDAPPITLVALRKGRGFKVRTLRTWENSDRSVLYVAVLQPGRFTRTEAAEGALDPGEVQTLRSKLPGIATGQTESTEIGYFYRAGRWVHVFIAD